MAQRNASDDTLCSHLDRIGGTADELSTAPMERETRGFLGSIIAANVSAICR
jgi:hypothetical protein